MLKARRHIQCLTFSSILQRPPIADVQHLWRRRGSYRRRILAPRNIHLSNYPIIPSLRVAGPPLRPSQTAIAWNTSAAASQRLQAKTAMTYWLFLRPMTILNEQPGSRHKALSAQPSVPPSNFAGLCPHLNLAHHHDRSDRRIPLQMLNSTLTPRISTLLSLPIFSVEEAGAVNFTSDRLADNIGALDERSAKRLMRSVIPQGTQFPI